MRESPRQRRLVSDHRLLTQLATDSSIFRFEATGSPPEYYIIRFHGRGAYRPDPAAPPRLLATHEVHVRLGAMYPRAMPELIWKTPIFHPNISAGGVVCLGGYGKHWVPSLMLDELCSMLWDMIRYENYDPNSPYNREAASWSKVQGAGVLPLDPRPLRDLVAAREAAAKSPGSVVDATIVEELRPPVAKPASASRPAVPSPPPARAAVEDDVFFIDDGAPAAPPPRTSPRGAGAPRAPSPTADDGIEFI